MTITIGLIAAGGTTALLAPPPVVAQDIRSPYRTYTVGDQFAETKDGMADNAALEAAISELARKIDGLGKKTFADYAAMWAPGIAVVAAITALSVGVSNRVGELEKKVDAGFLEIRAAISALDKRLSVDEVKPTPQAVTPSNAKN